MKSQALHFIALFAFTTVTALITPTTTSTSSSTSLSTCVPGDKIRCSPQRHKKSQHGDYQTCVHVQDIGYVWEYKNCTSNYVCTRVNGVDACVDPASVHVPTKGNTCSLVGKKRCLGKTEYVHCNGSKLWEKTSCAHGENCQELMVNNVNTVACIVESNPNSSKCSINSEQRCIGKNSTGYETCTSGFWTTHSCAIGEHCVSDTTNSLKAKCISVPANRNSTNCDVNGAVRCTGGRSSTAYSTCRKGKWVVSNCTAGTFCQNTDVRNVLNIQCVAASPSKINKNKCATNHATRCHGGGEGGVDTCVNNLWIHASCATGHECFRDPSTNIASCV